MNNILIGRFLSWLGSDIFTLGNVLRDTSLQTYVIQAMNLQTHIKELSEDFYLDLDDLRLATFWKILLSSSGKVDWSFFHYIYSVDSKIYNTWFAWRSIVFFDFDDISIFKGFHFDNFITIILIPVVWWWRLLSNIDRFVRSFDKLAATWFSFVILYGTKYCNNIIFRSTQLQYNTWQLTKRQKVYSLVRVSRW